MGKLTRTTDALLVATLGLGGCYAGLNEPVGADAETTPGGVTGDSDGDDGDTDSDDGETGDSEVDDACDNSEAPPVALRFLTRLEYARTIEDLLGDSRGVVDSFVPDEAAGGFAANSFQAPSATQLERFVDAAKTLATVAVHEERTRFVDCSADDMACIEPFVTQFGRRVFRRPLTDDEVAAYVGDAQAIAADQGAALGMEVAATAMLASPNFLYVGLRSEADAKLRAYDLASRLSYFLWASMPDQELLDAAADGTLDEHDGLELQVRRMMQDERATAMLRSFSAQWLEIDDLNAHTTKNAELFPEWTAELADAAELESATLLEHVVLDGDARLASLLNSREAWVDASLAELYGVPVPAGGEGWVELPAGERAGPVTRVAVLAGHAHADGNSWVHRGKIVRERMLCTTLPPPPPVADDSPINDDSRLSDPSCATCHTLMDPIGIGLDGYDPIGRFVSAEGPGEVVGLEQPKFDGGVDLAQRLADEPQVATCFAQQMYRFAHRRAVTPADACAVEAIDALFLETDGDIAELIVALATSRIFAGWEAA